MSIWSRLTTTISELGQNNPLIRVFRGPPEQSVGFTIAIIALCAKMAKADGKVTRDEVRTLREVFSFREEDEDGIARVFDLARKDVAGFEEYATKIRKMFVGRPDMLNDIFEGLFQIALADGVIHPDEDAFLERVHDIFELPQFMYDQLKARYISDELAEPLAELGLDANASLEDIRTAYRKIIRENHPDQMRARGLPEEALHMAEARVRSANAAYEALGRP